MQNLYRKVSLSHFRSRTLYCKPDYSPFALFLLFCIVSYSLSQHLNSNPSLSNFLVDSVTFSAPQAVSISSRFPPTKTLENPKAVVQLLKQLGFSDAHARSTIRIRPKTLFSNIDKTLKPKLQFFQDLGLNGPDLGKFISTHSNVLCSSLERTLIPCVDIIKNTLVNDENNQDLIRTMQQWPYCYGVTSKSELKLKCNIAFLESCGFVGSQLSFLLKRRPSLFFIFYERAAS
ncbi:hypothetical protein RHGRI_029908 [Rhododendron griersonianum]|uniref:Uncharacterized protein n=1 Tax=Rhododendron griersonianum TaxID=479676 RepID=A0AAV6IPH4_9ERIC|nr:hypothetical protein RHGRI_029908 [Rhododendron griersonianum]